MTTLLSPTHATAGAREVALAEVVAALSHALDLTQGQPRGHAGRSCILGLRIASDIGLDREAQSNLYYAILLKDSGCSSSAARMSEIFGGGDDIELKRAGKLVDFSRPSEALRFLKDQAGGVGALGRAREVLMTAIRAARMSGEIVETRCDRGARIVAGLGFPEPAADAVRALDEHWDGSGKPLGLRGEAIPVLARIACLAQTADVFTTAYGPDTARRMVSDRRARWFDPGIADAFLAIGDDDPIWATMRDAPDPAAVAAAEPDASLRIVHDSDLDRLAEAFAQVIDAKSPYTFNHSTGVARFAMAIAREMDVPIAERGPLRRAALLHDIGKLGVSNGILDKPGKLTDEEFTAVRHHPRFTEEILSRVSAFAPIAFVAGAHHERLDGRGYHRGLTGDDLPRDARILAVADVFEAMHADRPYRAGMPVERILDIMRGEIGSAFCGDCVTALETGVAWGIEDALSDGFEQSGD